VHECQLGAYGEADHEHYNSHTLNDSGENEGKLQIGEFILGGRDFVCIDSPVKMEFGFTPAISIFVDFESSDELERRFAALSADGEVMMPLDNYGFSKAFGWTSDKYGVSWQLNLPWAPFQTALVTLLCCRSWQRQQHWHVA